MRQILLAVSTAMAVALAVAVSLLGAGAPAAQAGVEWCEFDPLVMIHTPGGHHVPLHVTTYAEGPQHAAALRSAWIETQTAATRQGRATQVTITVLIPNDGTREGTVEPFRTRSVVSTKPGGNGTVLATASGRSGTVMTLRFTLDVA